MTATTTARTDPRAKTASNCKVAKGKPTMRNALLKLARRQWITPLTALREVGCLSLSQRMGELARDGVLVLKDWRDLPGGKRVRAYRVVAAK